MCGGEEEGTERPLKVRLRRGRSMPESLALAHIAQAAPIGKGLTESSTMGRTDAKTKNPQRQLMYARNAVKLLDERFFDTRRSGADRIPGEKRAIARAKMTQEPLEVGRRSNQSRGRGSRLALDPVAALPEGWHARSDALLLSCVCFVLSNVVILWL